MEKKRPIRVVLADDHEVVLEGHEKWLSDDGRFAVVGKSRTVEEAVELCRLQKPDIAVVDLRFFDRDRPEICKWIKEVSPGTRVAMYSAFSSAEQVSAAFQAGADGYFDKHAEGAFLPEVAACGGDVMGVDWHMPLDWCWAQIGHARPIQGNLEPVALLSPWRELRARTDAVLAQAAGRSGHIFNLGHGIFPQTPVENVQRLVEYVHETTGATTP